ncbi:MAG: thermonuclease family protein [Candidatus Nealsonbacteria bacterium]|nr:thermonuclease family protein [Candidatus Nealsonbacteria bacterium]
MRHFSRRPQNTLIVVVLLLIVAVMRWWPPEVEPEFQGELQERVYRVQRVIDGDTLVLVNGARIRLIGADTPETYRANEPYGPEATEFTRQFVSGGEVRLQFDGRRKDKYQRFLAHVWVNDEMLAEELIRAGLAEVTDYPYSAAVKQRLKTRQQEAKAAGRRIWSH